MQVWVSWKLWLWQQVIMSVVQLPRSLTTSPLMLFLKLLLVSAREENIVLNLHVSPTLIEVLMNGSIKQGYKLDKHPAETTNRDSWLLSIYWVFKILSRTKQRPQAAFNIITAVGTIKDHQFYGDTGCVYGSGHKYLARYNLWSMIMFLSGAGF